MKYFTFCFLAASLLIGKVFAQVTVDKKDYTVEECISLAKVAENEGRIRDATDFLNCAAYYVWGDLKKYDLAIDLYQQSVELNKLISNSSGIAGINNNLAMIYFDKGDYETSLAYTKKVLDSRKQLKNKTPVVSAMVNTAMVLNKLKRYDESISYLKDAVVLAGEIEDKEQMRTCYGILIETYNDKGDTKEARQYYELFRTINDAIQKEDGLKAKSEIERTRYAAQLAEVEKRNAEAEKRNKELELELSNQQLSETKQELEVIDSTNKELLQQTTKYELLVSNLQQKEQIKQLEQQRLQSQLEWEKKARWYTICGLVLALLLVALLFYAYRQKRQMNRMLKARNEQIVAQAKALREENMVRTKLLSVISHDLRSPLSSVHLMIQLLKANTFSPEQSQVHLAKLENSLQNAFALLDNLLFWAKSQLNGINPKPEIFDFSRLIAENLELLSAGLQGKNVTAVNNVGSCEVYADREITKLVLRNLLSNALKFSPTGGTITLSSRIKDDMLEVAIADNGIGIPKDKQAAIFTPKVSNSVGTNNEPSSGMGLIICQDFITRSGGRIWFESEEGKGSTFYFTLLLK